jgi:ABC-type spermidine/putrescine transport system permease subunit II
MVMFSALKLGLTPELFALATVIIVVVSAGLLLALRLGRVASARAGG